jgi:membrane protease YdiL (CAAX protease family)
MVLEVLLVFVGLFVGWAVLAVVGALGLLPEPGSEQAINMLYGPVATVIAALLVVSVARRAKSATPGAPGPKAAAGGAAWMVAAHVGLAIGGSLLIGKLFELLGMPVQEQETVRRITEAAREGTIGAPMILLGVSAVAAAPAAEEWLFRGLLFRRIHHVGGRVPAYVLSALAFATIHGNPEGLAIYAWLGLVFASSYERTGRLWCAMLVHLCNNALALALLLE